MMMQMMKRKGAGDGGAGEECGDAKSSALNLAKRGAPAAAEAAMAGVKVAPPSHSSSSSYSHNNRVSNCGIADNPASASASASASLMNWSDPRKLRRRLHGDLQTVKGLIARLEARERVLSSKDLGHGKGSGSGTDSAQLSSSGQETGGGAVIRDGGIGFPAKRRTDAADAFTKERSAVGARMALAANGSDFRGRAKKTEDDQRVGNHVFSEIKQPKHSDPITKATDTKDFLFEGNNSRGVDTEAHRVHRVAEGGVISRPASVSNIWSECLNILEDLLKNRNAWAFEKPVLLIWPHLFDYTNRIKSPMDLGTVKMKLLNGEYSDPWEFAADVRLTFANAFSYNEKGSAFYNSAKHINLRFDTKFRSLEVRSARMPDRHMAGPRDHASEAKTVARPGSGVLVQNGVATQSNKLDPTEEKLPVDHMNEGIQPRKVHKKPKSKQRLEKPPSSRLGRSTSAFAYGGVRPLTAKERERLPLLIESLPADRVKKVIEILKQRNPAFLESANGEVELDLGKFDEETMFELYRLAMNWQKSKKKVLGRVQPFEDLKEPVQNNAGTSISGKGHSGSPSEVPAQPAHRKNRKDEDGGGVKAPYSGKGKVIGSPRQEASGSASESSSSSGSSSGSSSSSGSGSDSESDADSDQSSQKA